MKHPSNCRLSTLSAPAHIRFALGSARWTAALVAAIGVAAFSPSAQAASQIWDGDTDANWATTANWVGNAAPGSTTTGNADTATFNTNPANGTTIPLVIDSGRRLGNILFDTANVGPFVIGSNAGNQLTFGTNNTGVSASIIMNSTVNASQEIAAPLLLNWYGSGGQNMKFLLKNDAASSAAVLKLTGAINATYSTNRAAQVTLDGSNTGDNIISGAMNFTNGIVSVPNLTKNGAGTWILSGANTFSGQALTVASTTNGIQINAGVLVAANNLALGNTTSSINNYINNGGTLELNSNFNGSIVLDNALTLQLMSGGTIRSNGSNGTNSKINLSTAAAVSSTLSAVNAADVFTVGNGSNDFTGGASDTVVHIGGAGTVLLSSTSNYAGTVSVDTGTLRLGSDTALGTLGSVNVASGAKLQLNGTAAGGTPTVTVLTGAGMVENFTTGASTLTASIATSNTFGGVLQNGSGGGTLKLTKTGAGILTLSGTSTATGATAINAGTLNVTGTLGNSAVSGTSGAILAGNGILGGAVSVASGVRIAPGDANTANSIGNLTVGSLALNAGSQLDYNITNTSTLDQVTVSTSSGLTINGGQLNINGGTSFFTANGVYNLIGYSGTLNGAATNLALNANNNDTATKTYNFGATGSFVTLTVASSGAAPNFWNTDSSSNWNTAGNWSLNVVPNAVGDFAAFGGGGTEITDNRTVTVNGTFTVGTLAFNGAAHGKSYTLANGGGASLTLDNGASGSFVTTTSGSHTIQVPLVLTTNGATFTAGGSDVFSVSGVISGTGPLTKAGGGTVALTGTNTFIGNVALNSGTTAINNANSFGDSANAVTINAATLQATEDITGTRNFTLGNAASAISVNATRTYTVGGVVSGSGALNKSGSGTLALTGNNTYNGGTVINAGTVAVNSATSLGDAAGAVTINNAILQSSGTFSDAHNFTLGNANSTIQVDSGIYTVNGVVDGSGTLNKTGAGGLTLNGSNSFAAAILNAGIVRLGSSNAGIGTGTVTFQGGTLNSQSAGGADPGGGGFGLVNNFVVAGGQTGTLNLAFRGNLTGSLTGAGTFNVNVHGTRDDFSGNWSAFTGQINVGTQTGFGDFRINNTNGFGTARLNLASGVNMSVLINFGAGGATFNAGEISGAAGSFLGGGPVAGRVATWSVGAANTNATFAGIIRDGGTGGQGTGPTAITKVGSQTWTLTGANAYTGLTTVTLGTLAIGDGGTIGSLGTGNVTNNAILAFNRSDAVTVANNITGTGAIHQNGGGSTTFTGTNTANSLLVHAGTALVDTGSIAVNGFVSVGNQGGETGVLTVQNGGALSVTGTGDLNVSDLGSSTGTLNVTGGTVSTTSLWVGKNFLNAPTGGTGTVNQNGGTVTVNGANGVTLASGTASTGTYHLNGGTLTTQKVSKDAAGTSGTFNFNGGTLQASAANATFMSGLTAANVRAGGASINDGGFAVTIGQNLIHDPALGGTADGGLGKSGIGTLTLAGASSYTGPTNVSAGTLEISGSIGASTNPGTSALNLTGGTTLLSGASGEQVNNSAAVNLGGGKLAFDTSSNNQLETLGVLTLSANSIIDFGLAGGNDTFSFAALPVRTGGTLTIENWVGNLAGGIDGTNDRLVFAGNLNDFTFGQADVSFTGYGPGYAKIDFGGTSYEIVPVPEPSSTALLGGAGLLGLIGFRERRRLVGGAHRRPQLG